MKVGVFLRVLAILAGAVIGCVLAVWFVLWVSLRSSAVRVPQLAGLETTSAMASLQDAGLVARLQEGVFDAQVPVGRVARQRPGAGFEVKRGATVLLFPSLGTAVQKVGDLVGLPTTLAESEIEGENLVAGRRCVVDGQADGAVVVAQTPSGGALVPPGSAVSLLVNRARRETRFVMPDFAGMNETDATRVLRALGFQLATVQRVAYPGVAAGQVLRQDPPAGGPVVEAAVVGLWVSR